MTEGELALYKERVRWWFVSRMVFDVAVFVASLLGIGAWFFAGPFPDDRLWMHCAMGVSFAGAVAMELWIFLQNARVMEASIREDGKLDRAERMADRLDYAARMAFVLGVVSLFALRMGEGG